MDYSRYLDNLKGMVLFAGMSDEEILTLLDAMNPPIKEGFLTKPTDGGPHRAFRLVVDTVPAIRPRERRFAYDLPGHGEPGMLMGEVLVFSRKEEYVMSTPLSIKKDLPPVDWEVVTIELTPEMLTAPHGERVAVAQGKMLRNMLGILAQKVTDVRRELYLERSGFDIYSSENLVCETAHTRVDNPACPQSTEAR